MKQINRFALCTSFAVAAFMLLAPSQFTSSNSLIGAVAAAQDQYGAPPADQGPDPAAVNQAPSGPSYTTEAPPPPDQSAAPGQGPDDSNYAEQPTATADQPPPPLPDYDQPPAPADGYLWTPGYWAWGPAGYYWVPGAWVEPPYIGALWTPGYWGFYGSRYSFYPGYWGLHIGFYGGINYGFGFGGFGYEGGYWNSGHFFYNRVYNHINVRNVHNVYSYRANVNVRGNAASRASFRGGAGVQAQRGGDPVGRSRLGRLEHQRQYESLDPAHRFVGAKGRAVRAVLRLPGLFADPR